MTKPSLDDAIRGGERKGKTWRQLLVEDREYCEYTANREWPEGPYKNRNLAVSAMLKQALAGPVAKVEKTADQLIDESSDATVKKIIHEAVEVIKEAKAIIKEHNDNKIQWED
jgi:hypothetical protein